MPVSTNGEPELGFEKRGKGGETPEEIELMYVVVVRFLRKRPTIFTVNPPVLLMENPILPFVSSVDIVKDSRSLSLSVEDLWRAVSW